jgi:hypothetical protein
MAIHSTRKLLVESWPTAPTIELSFALVQRGSAACAYINAIFKVLIVFPSARRLCAFLAKDVVLLGSENILPGLTKQRWRVSE